MEKYSREAFEHKETEIANLEKGKTALLEQAHEEAIVENITKDTEREQHGNVSDELHGKLSRAERQVLKRKLEGPINRQVEIASEILDERNVFGPNEVAKTWLVYPENIPNIPFSLEELEHAKEMGQMLVLRVDKTSDGKPMSPEIMNNILVKKWENTWRHNDGILDTVNGWKKVIGEDRFKKEAPRPGWALVSQDLLPDSRNKNYIQQTDIIIKALREKVFKDIEMPKEYQEAIQEFESNKDQLTEITQEFLMMENWKKAGKQLSELKITKLTRQTFPEAIYDIGMCYNRHHDRLFSEWNIWLGSLDSEGDPVVIGYFSQDGLRAGKWGGPAYRDDGCGVSLSRRS